jgi:tRNA threonylcarbamoyl adenosine modification protein YeaZ
MYSLFIDNFNDINLFLFINEKFLSIKEKKDVKNSSEYTLPLIMDLLKENNISPFDIKRVIVCNGPGSFTGVRIGITIAKTISYSCNCELYTVDSLTLAAMNNKSVCNIGVKENNGVYFAKFNNKQITSDIKYLKFNDLENSNIEIIYNDNIDYNLIIKNINYFKLSNCFDACPLYVKSIEALNDKKN